jgi:glutamyl-tRNA synthetase
MSDSTFPVVRTRMAPSPTGEYHVGHIATLLKNYAFAKGRGGKFILRIEDTDQERKVEGAVERIMDVIHAYGLDWDEGPSKGGPHAPYVQSERLPSYIEKAKELVAAGKAYYCFCSAERLEQVRESQREAKLPPKYDRRCRSLSAAEVEQRLAAGESSVIRLKVPDNVQIKFTDLIRGEIEMNSDSVDDQVLLKSDGFPTYHLAVVVDDHAMEISHILRGEEWISSTPKHVLLYQAFGWPMPVFAHIPVFLNPDGQGKMSKRKGTVAAASFLEAGYLPEAMLNFFMILGWARADQTEILTLDEYIKEFDPKDISAKSVVFDLNKLAWLNGMYIRQLPPAELEKRLQPYIPADFPREQLPAILPLVMERLVKLSDFEELTSFFYRDIALNTELLLKKSDVQEVTEQLTITRDALKSLSEWSVATLEVALRDLQANNFWKKSQYFMLIRVAVTGRAATPPLFETMEIIGKAKVLARIETALNQVGTHA